MNEPVDIWAASAAASGQLSAELTPAAVSDEAEQLSRELVRKQKLGDTENSASDLAALPRGHKNKARYAKYWDKLAVDLVIRIRLQPSACFKQSGFEHSNVHGPHARVRMRFCSCPLELHTARSYGHTANHTAPTAPYGPYAYGSMIIFIIIRQKNSLSIQQDGGHVPMHKVPRSLALVLA